MVRIRLRRVGARHQPSFRIVAADKESPRDGRFLEIIGHYKSPHRAGYDQDQRRPAIPLAEKNGAQPSESVAQLMRTSGAQERWERFKAGESLETLLAEAAAMEVEIDPRTHGATILPRHQRKPPNLQVQRRKSRRRLKKRKKTEAAAEEAVIPEEAATPEVEVAAEVEASEEEAPAEEEPAAPEVEVPAEVEASEEAAPTEEEPAAEEEAPDAEE